MVSEENDMSEDYFFSDFIFSKESKWVKRIYESIRKCNGTLFSAKIFIKSNPTSGRNVANSNQELPDLKIDGLSEKELFRAISILLKKGAIKKISKGIYQENYHPKEWYFFKKTEREIQLYRKFFTMDYKNSFVFGLPFELDINKKISNAFDKVEDASKELYLEIEKEINKKYVGILKKQISKLYLSSKAATFLKEVFLNKKFSILKLLTPCFEIVDKIRTIPLEGAHTTILFGKDTSKEENIKFVAISKISNAIFSEKEKFERLSEKDKIDVVKTLLNFIKSNELLSLKLYFFLNQPKTREYNPDKNFKEAQFCAELMDLNVK